MLEIARPFICLAIWVSLITTIGCSSSTAGNNVSNPTPGNSSSNTLTTTTAIPADLAWDSASQRIYFSTPNVAAAGAAANTVGALDPTTGKVAITTPVGDTPGPLSISSTGKYVYVGVKGLNLVQRLTLPTLASDIQITLGTSPLNGPYYATGVQAAPSSDQTIAVSRTDGSIVIYDDKVARAASLCGDDLAKGCKGPEEDDWIQFMWNTAGDAIIATTISSPSDLGYLPVGSAGFLDYAGPIVSNNNLGVPIPSQQSVHFDPTTGLVYRDDGGIVDPVLLKFVGSFDANTVFDRFPVMVPDAKRNKAYFLVNTRTAMIAPDSFAIKVFDLTSHSLLATVPLSDAVVGAPKKIIRWGTSGLAFTMTNTTGIIQQPSPIFLVTNDAF
jgi:hypothetical protein